MSEVSDLLGKTLTKINVEEDEIKFHCESGEVYKMYHGQNCCESVCVDDISGDIEDLIGTPITMAEEISNDLPAKDSYDESYTWTFYKLATVKGYVNIKWYGTSNGYYSEGVDFVKL